MRWFPLLVALSMGDEENLQLLSRPPLLTHLPTCDLFLAPSTIPGSACVNIQQKNNVLLRAVWAATVQILCFELLGCFGDIFWLTAVRLYIWTICLSNPFIANTFTPWFLQTAGFGVFAGRAFALRILERAPLKTVNKEQTCIKGSSKFHGSTASNKEDLRNFSL